MSVFPAASGRGVTVPVPLHDSLAEIGGLSFLGSKPPAYIVVNNISSSP